jgi:ribonuclease H-related protein
MSIKPIWPTNIMGKYYAVAKGVTPGIYTDWPTTQKMVNGFPKAVFKSFTTKQEAEEYMRLYADKSIAATQSQILPKDTIIYTDGSMNEGRCGFGVVIITNVGDKFEAYGHVPKYLGVTNNVAELYAIYVALSLVQGDVSIYSDSTYAIGVLTGWNAKVNIDIIESIKRLLANRTVKFQHVDAHSGITYNEEADRLADRGRTQEKELIVIKNGQLVQL